jgi:hypothetical protein
VEEVAIRRSHLDKAERYIRAHPHISHACGSHVGAASERR